MDKLYKKISDLCESNNISISKMCKDVGVSRGNISDLKMNRIKSLSLYSLQRIADYFGVTVDYLMGNEDKTKHIFKFGEFDPDRMVHAIRLLQAETTNIPDDAASDVETDDIAIFDRVCQLTGHYTRLKRDDLSGYYLGKRGEEKAEVFLSNKEFRALVKRISASASALIDSEIEDAKDEETPK